MRSYVFTQNRRFGLLGSFVLALVGLAALFLVGMMVLVVVIPLSIVGWWALRKKLKLKTVNLKTYSMQDGWPPQHAVRPDLPVIEKQD